MTDLAEIAQLVSCIGFEDGEVDEVAMDETVLQIDRLPLSRARWSPCCLTGLRRTPASMWVPRCVCALH